MLLDDGHQAWVLVVGDRWSARAVQMASSLAFGFVGNLTLRCWWPFLQWPWLLARAAHPDCSPEDLASLSELVWELHPCCTQGCDGFTRRFRETLSSPDDLGLPENIRYLRECFEMCEPQNILTEDRFGRLRRHCQTCTGQCVGADTMSSNHMSAEWNSMYEVSKDMFFEVFPAGDCAQPSSSGQPVGAEQKQRWKNFV
eukprot:4772423-Alexandrium_andersonii.AAC.1